ncbi:MAG: tripartite tricarboxylate transporter TctB family protein, partial [Candidatus Binatia bacterium]
MPTLDRISGALLLFMALIVVWESRVLPLGTLHNPGPGYMPILLASLLAGLSVLIILLGGRSPSLSSLKWTGGRHALAILAACAFSALALERIGFRVTMLLLLVFLLGVVERL